RKGCFPFLPTPLSFLFFFFSFSAVHLSPLITHGRGSERGEVSRAADAQREGSGLGDIGFKRSRSMSISLCSAHGTPENMEPCGLLTSFIVFTMSDRGRWWA